MADRDDEKDLTRVQLKDVRLSYPALWKAKGFGKNNEGEPAYQASFLIDENDKLGKKMIDLCEDAIDEAKYKKWGDKQPKLKADKICLKEGDPDDGDEFDGMMVLSSRNYKKPRVLDRDKLDVEDGDDGAPYAGCYVDAIVRFWAQDNEFGKRINCSLEAVRFRRDGEAFGAKPVDPDEFEDLDDDGGRSSRRRSRDEDDDDRGSRRRGRGRDDEDGDERPGRRRGRGKDDDGDDRRSRRPRDDDDDGDDRRSRRSRSRDDDDDDDRRSRRSRDDDDDDDRRSRRSRDDDDDVDRPSRNSRSRDRDDDKGNDRRSRRRRDHDDI